MATEANVQVILKIGQVPMTELVCNAAKHGFALAGSPTLIAGIPAQLMVRTDKMATDPEYKLVTKDATNTMAHQIEQMLNDGWRLYGSMITGLLPTQAMVKGDIASYSIGLGGGSTGEGSGPAPQDWEIEIAKVNENITEIYNVLNSLPNPQTDIDIALAAAKAYTDTELGVMSVKIDKKFEFYDNNIQQLWDYIESRYGDVLSTLRGEIMGVTQYVDAEIIHSTTLTDVKLDDMKNELHAADASMRTDFGTFQYELNKYQQEVNKDTQDRIRHEDENFESIFLSMTQLDANTENLSMQHVKDIVDLTDYVNISSEQTLNDAKAYTDQKVGTDKDWAEQIEKGDEAVLESAIAFAKEAVTHAKEIWETGDAEVRNFITQAHVTGSNATPMGNTASPVTVSVNDNGTSRTTSRLQPSDSYPDGFVKHYYNCTGNPDSEEWGGSLRVHLDEPDYEAGYSVQGGMGIVGNSVVIKPLGFAVLILDKAKKKWFFSGQNVAVSDAKGPLNRNPEGDSPAAWL